MTRERCEQILFAHVSDEVVQDMLNQYVLELESSNAKLRELVRNLLRVIPHDVSGVVIGAHGEHPTYYSFADAMRELGVEVEQ